jgi:hypothetical protein
MTEIASLIAKADALVAQTKDEGRQTLLAQIAKLQAENEKLKQSQQSRLTLKIGEKGALSVYGMGRFPVTLYRSQWERLIAIIPQIEAFIQANANKLAVKE